MRVSSEKNRVKERRGEGTAPTLGKQGRQSSPSAECGSESVFSRCVWDRSIDFVDGSTLCRALSEHFVSQVCLIISAVDEGP